MQKEKLNIELSYKLFDAVVDAEDDGVIFTSKMRSAYIDRAFQRLVKILEDLEDESLHSMFKNIYKISEPEVIDDDDTINASNYDSIKAIYIEKGDATSTGVGLE